MSIINIKNDLDYNKASVNVSSIGFSIEGPSLAKIDYKDNGDGSANISYWPTVAGEYAVHILCNAEDIPQSPFMVDVTPSTTNFDPTTPQVNESNYGISINLVSFICKL